MAVTATELAQHIGLDDLTSEVEISFAAMTELFEARVGDVEIPGDVLDLAKLEVGEALYRRRFQPSGQSGEVALTPDAPVPVRQPKDPFDLVRALLADWLPGGFA